MKSEVEKIIIPRQMAKKMRYSSPDKFPESDPSSISNT